MAKNLVIVESPAKVKTIKKFLGSNYEVMASQGHVRDLPKSQLGIDVEHDYEPKYREFDVNLDREGKESKMYKELTQRIEKSKYDCIAHIHTHPFIGGTCRMFSNQDLKMIKSLQQDFQPRNGTNKYFFGGLLTVGPENTPETDEISFVFFDENYGWYKITNINVFLNNEEIPFSSVGEITQMQLR